MGFFLAHLLFIHFEIREPELHRACQTQLNQIYEAADKVSHLVFYSVPNNTGHLTGTELTLSWSCLSEPQDLAPQRYLGIHQCRSHHFTCETITGFALCIT